MRAWLPARAPTGMLHQQVSLDPPEQVRGVLQTIDDVARFILRILTPPVVVQKPKYLFAQRRYAFGTLLPRLAAVAPSYFSIYKYEHSQARWSVIRSDMIDLTVVLAILKFNDLFQHSLAESYR